MSSSRPSPEDGSTPGGTPTSPFEDPMVLHGEVVDSGHGPRSAGTGEPGDQRFAAFGTIPVGAFGVGSLLGRLAGSRDLRALLTTPIKLLVVAILVPTLLAVLLALPVDSTGGRALGFVLGGFGVLTAGVLELRRRRLIAAAPTVGRTTGKGPIRGLVAPVGLGLLAMMLAAGYDLLAVLLLAFGVW